VTAAEVTTDWAPGTTLDIMDIGFPDMTLITSPLELTFRIVGIRETSTMARLCQLSNLVHGKPPIYGCVLVSTYPAPPVMFYVGRSRSEDVTTFALPGELRMSVNVAGRQALPTFFCRNEPHLINSGFLSVDIAFGTP